MSGSLKQFEKWRNKNKYTLCSGPFQRGIKEGWRAALEWVENELNKAGDGFEPDLGLRNLLKKELGGQKNERI